MFFTVKENFCFGAMVNTLESDKIQFQLTASQQTTSSVEQLESWFDAGQVALFPSVLRHVHCT